MPFSCEQILRTLAYSKVYTLFNSIIIYITIYG